MLIINDAAELARVINSPLSPACKRILQLRGELIDIATFIVVQPADPFDCVQSALGFPIYDYAPPWEWVLHHGGAFEAPVIHSDDGSGTVLIVPDENGINPKLLNILRAYAEPADACGNGRSQADQSKTQ